MQAMNMKLGPALKICARIDQMRGLTPSSDAAAAAGPPTSPTDFSK
jgi:hypothetical protein